MENPWESNSGDGESSGWKTLGSRTLGMDNPRDGEPSGLEPSGWITLGMENPWKSNPGLGEQLGKKLPVLT